MLMIVVMKLMAPKIEDTPARWREKMVKSTEAPACARFPARGGYTVQPVPAPASIIEEARRSRNDGGSNQKRSEEHTSELQSRQYLVCRLLLEKKKITKLLTTQSRKQSVSRITP